MQVLVNILSTRGALEQAACLDALISLMLDSSINQKVRFYIKFAPITLILVLLH